MASDRLHDRTVNATGAEGIEEARRADGADDVERAGGAAGAARADRVGLGWRGELAAGIFAHLDRIDLVELIADDHFKASARELRPLKLLSSQAPVALHGVAMGLAGSEPVVPWRLDAMARLADSLGAVTWSEHLAFVRAGGHEIGHLAMPPRTARGVEAAVRHVEQATRVVGRAPLLENIATLVQPPGSALDEPAWTAAIVGGSGAPMLLDLHNLYANAVNFGHDPFEMLDAMPLSAVRAVHLSGGHWIDEPVLPGGERPARGQRLLDDHVHDVPDIVFRLLAHLASRVAGPLDVVIERDGGYPPFEVLLRQIDAARAALARGRKAAAARMAGANVAPPAPALAGAQAGAPAGPTTPGAPRSAEAFLAHLYADPAALARFLADPERAIAAAGLGPEQAAVMRATDRTGLVMAARSFQRKRESRGQCATRRAAPLAM